MTQHDLNRAIASRTGESVGEIRRRGFVPLTRAPIERNSEHVVLDACDIDPLDWDVLDQLRIGVLFPQRAQPASAF